MRLDSKKEIKIWSVYFATILISVYIHEIGHCIPAWMNGFKAIPTPAKEYIYGEIPDSLQQYISLGGIIGTVVVCITIMTIYWFNDFKFRSALLAGSLAIPGVYSFRFFIVGRGHDATEFQEAQAALGLGYSSHSLDWIFLGLLLFGMSIWIIKSKPQIKIAGRLLLGIVVTIIFVVGLQKINNAIFDPIFQN